MSALDAFFAGKPASVVIQVLVHLQATVYLSGAARIVFFYDWALTFDDEVRAMRPYQVMQNLTCPLAKARLYLARADEYSQGHFPIRELTP